MTNATVREVTDRLRKCRFMLHDEKHLQGQIEQELSGMPDVLREQALDEGGRDIIDFLIGTVGIEVKIKAGKRAIYKQCARYCATGRLTDLILFSMSTLGMPQEINGVNIYVLNPSHAWF